MFPRRPIGTKLCAPDEGQARRHVSKQAEVRKATRKRYWREADAQVVIESWRSSGESLARFARRSGVDEQRLRRWAALLAPRGREAVRFHPVRVAATTALPGLIEIHVSGCRVVASAGVRAEDLRQVLAAIREPAAC